MVSRAAFETLVAEHALKLLDVPDPRKSIAQGIMSKVLEEQNNLTGEGGVPQLLTAAAGAELHQTAIMLLGRALGECLEQTA
jgi:hypothetical protein